MTWTWRERARDVIASVVRDTVGLPTAERIVLINDAYPFGERARFPYKAWLVERKAAIRLLTGPVVPKSCPACGAKGVEPCRDIGGELMAGGVHVARLEVQS